jgi:hypothetical protein
LVGEWSKYQIHQRMKPVADNPYFFETFVQIQPGIYRYKYMVDQTWRYDPNEETQLNSYSTYDNVIQVFPAVYEINKEVSDTENQPIHTIAQNGYCVKIKTELAGKDLRVKGSWDNWQSEIPLHKSKFYVRLDPGIYRYSA